MTVPITNPDLKRKTTVSYRTTTPMDGLSPTTDKSRAVPLFGDTPLITDILRGGSPKIIDIHGRGNWGDGEDTAKNYREEGDEFMREEQQADQTREEALRKKRHKKVTEWVAEMEDGSERVFTSKEVAVRELSHMKSPYRRIFKRTAQSDPDSISRAMTGYVTIHSQSPGVSNQTGAGFCVDASGIYITCAHVVRPFDDPNLQDKSKWWEAKTYIVSASEEAQAEILLVDLTKDLAILRCPRITSAPMALADSRMVKRGEAVFAIGAPRGFGGNVSDGIISSTRTNVFWHTGSPKYIFTDAQVSPGSSGGPLVLYETGEVVGMMALIVGSGDGLPGLNAALPSEYVTEALKGAGIIR